MSPSASVTVRIDLQKIRDNAQSIRSLTGVELLAVVKADAYGLGATRVVPALADIVDGFCVFSFSEAVEARIWETTGKRTIALGPDLNVNVDEYLKERVNPSVWELKRAETARAAKPVLSIDTGMQRFCCPADQIEAILSSGQFDEAFTHATRLEQVEMLVKLVGNRGLKLHAAGSSLFHEPSARLDAVRPGLALYQGAVRVSTRLIDVRKSNGPVGYSGFSANHHGVIRAGYSNGLRSGPCLINGLRSRILEVGMQSAYVETIAADRVGDEVVLLGDGLTEAEVAAVWKSGPHEVLTKLCGAGVREYVG
jgi:alanine racemase